MVSPLLIYLYVSHEFSYDRFHPYADRIYRVNQTFIWGENNDNQFASTGPGVAYAVKEELPEVELITSIHTPGNFIISYTNESGEVKSFEEERILAADTNFFKMFNFPFLKGDFENALTQVQTLIMTESTAKKYFGEEDPMGKTISWDGNRKFEVTGIFENLPDNSHIKFDFMFSYETLNQETKNESETNWGWYDFNTYVLLQPGTDAKALQSKWDEWLLKDRGEEWKKRNAKQEFILEPLLDIHLYSNLLQESQPEERGDGDSVYALSIIAFFILVIAWVNYINLATAKSFERANEVGVRKVMGAQKNQLMNQFLSEAFLVNLLAAFISVVAVWLIWPFFANLSGRNIPLAYLGQPDFWLLLGALFFVGTILSGFYPALVLSSFKPVAVLKGKVMHTVHGNFLRKSLVVFQFVASVVFISGSVIVYQQLKFMRSQDLGIDIKQTVVLKGPGVVVDSLFIQNLEGMKAEALRIPGIKSMTASSNVPGDEIFWASGIRRINGGPENSISGYTVGIDHDYVPAFDLNVVAGRNFDLDHPNEKKSVIINEAMSVALNFENPKAAIGEKVRHGGDTIEIVGVLENYHQMSLKEVVTPLVYRYTPDFASFFAFKVESDNYSQIVSSLQEPWETFFPGNPMDYFFLDQFFNRQYDQDRKFSQIFALFTLLIIFVACLGLFGLASFMTLQRTKEIGIRKALGSTSSEVILLLSKGFVQLVLIANLIAWPLAWYLMDNWLQSFPYRININPVLFVLAGLGVVVIAFLSVAWQTMKAAKVNPAITLKNE